MNFLLTATAFDFAAFVDNIGATLASFRVADAIEIFILSVIFFFAFRFLRSKKTGALLFGILFCLILLGVSIIFDFKVLQAFFGAIAASGVIVIIVILQPEIRDALERVGTGSHNSLMSFGDRKKKKELYYSVIDNICLAVKELSAEYTGALIVIERTTRLSDIAGSGVGINADVNALLIRNLFYNKAPLHDGALVIMDARIAAAGCFLPLSRRADIDPDLGTRHRAALGMAESSDAITIVVSEETGKISVAHDCKLNIDMSVDEVKAFLTENIIRPSGNRSI